MCAAALPPGFETPGSAGSRACAEEPEARQCPDRPHLRSRRRRTAARRQRDGAGAGCRPRRKIARAPRRRRRRRSKPCWPCAASSMSRHRSKMRPGRRSATRRCSEAPRRPCSPDRHAQGRGRQARQASSACISTRIEKLVTAARDNPARSVEAIRARLAEQVARLMEASASFDQDRLHQEAVLLATRADIAEEIDRLFAHIEAARKLLLSSDPAGRQLDFLVAGIQPRGQYAVLQGVRSLAYGDRAGVEDRHRPDARAGAEH